MIDPPRAYTSSEIIVAGFHRSGTSSVARLLHAAGLFVGDKLLGAVPYNPYGHYEDRDVVTTHAGILGDNGLSWQVSDDLVPVISELRWRQMDRLVERRRLAHRLWGFKDPRACFFLPAWKHLMPDVKVLIVYRSPGDSCYSLVRRHARELFEKSGPQAMHRRFFSVADLAARMWLVHNRALIEYAKRHPEDVIVVSFDSLLRGLPLTRLLRQTWGAPLQEIPTFAALDPLATTRREHPQPLSDATLGDQLDGVLEELRSLEHETLASSR